MKLDTANRAFLALAALGGTAYIIAGFGACAVLCLVAYRLSAEGLNVLVQGGERLWFALLFLGLVGTGALLGLWSLHRQLAATRRLADSVRRLRIRVPPAVEIAATGVGLSTRRLDIVDAPETFSFAYGIFRPRVAVSRAFVAAASPQEIQAVLEHEGYHLRNWDPLKVVFARALPAAFYYLPVLRDLRTRYVAGRELAADQQAIQTCGRASLAGALYKVVGDPAWANLGASAAISGTGVFDLRVAQLEEGREPPVPPISQTASALSVLGLGVLVASLAVSVTGAGGPWTLMRLATPPAIATPLRLTGLTVCGAFWAWVAWQAWTFLRPHREGLDTTHP